MIEYRNLWTAKKGDVVINRHTGRQQLILKAITVAGAGTITLKQLSKYRLIRLFQKLYWLYIKNLTPKH